MSTVPPSASSTEATPARPGPHPRLVAADVLPLDGATLVVARSGATFRVDADPAVVHRLLASLDGSSAVPDALHRAGAPDGFAEVVEVLGHEGCVMAGPAAVPRIVLAGHGAAHRELSRALARSGGGLEDREPPGGVPVEEVLAGLDPAGDVLVVAADRFDRERLEAIDRLAADAGLRWTQLHLTASGAVWGPHVEPGRTADYRDVLQRRRCAIDEPLLFEALVSDPVGPAAVPAPAELAWLAGGFAADVTAWLEGRPCRALSCEVEADITRLELRVHPVLPLPDHRLDGPLRINGEGPDLLISERTGIIQRTRPIRHHGDVPPRLRTVQTHNSSMARVDPEWANDVITGGSVFDDEAAAVASAIGEAVERYCGNHMGQNELCWASYDELTARGEHAVDPDSLVLYSDATYDSPGCPFVRFTHSLPVRWVRGRSLTHDRPVWLPVTLVFVNWLAAEGSDHPLTNYMNFSGVAAGTSLEHALVSGIEELVERDATMIWWMNGHPLPSVALSPDLAAVVAGTPAEAGQRAWLIHLDNEFDIPVMAGLAEHGRDGYFTIGFAARPDPAEAARKAWTEAFTLQEGSRDLDRPDSLIRQAITWGFASYVDLKPWRADRRYLDDYRDDFRDVSDLMCQQQVYLDRRAVDAVRHITHTPEARTFGELPSLPDRSLATYRSRVEGRGFEICYVDCTTPDVAAAGFHAVRVVIPGLVGNAPAAFPLLGRRRVQEMAVQLGWRARPLDEHELNYWPIPHA